MKVCEWFDFSLFYLNILEKLYTEHTAIQCRNNCIHSVQTNTCVFVDLIYSCVLCICQWFFFIVCCIYYYLTLSLKMHMLSVYFQQMNQLMLNNRFRKNKKKNKKPAQAFFNHILSIDKSNYRTYWYSKPGIIKQNL